MNTSPRIKRREIAQQFIALHKEKMRVDWVDDLLDTYYKMEGGVYGEAHEENGNFWLEIGRLESESGNPVIFEWSLND